jgi:putative hydrolase of the HAD superfamily
MIGDSLDADVQGALDMGLDAIFLMDKVQVEQEIKQVNHLLELKNIYNHESKY